MSNEEVQSEPFSAETYFATQPPPPSLEEDVARVRDFVQRQQKAGRKVALVTVRSMLVDIGMLCSYMNRVVEQLFRLSSTCEHSGSGLSTH